MVQDGAGCGGAVSHVAVVEGTDEHFFNDGNEHFPKGLFGAIVPVEDGGGNVMGVSKVRDLGAQRNRWDSRLGAGVDRSDEGRGEECFVHDRGDIELQQSECLTTQFRLDGCGV